LESPPPPPPSHDAAADFPWVADGARDAGTPLPTSVDELRKGSLADGRYRLEAFVFESMTHPCPPGGGIRAEPGNSGVAGVEDAASTSAYIFATGAPPEFPRLRRYGLTIDVKGDRAQLVAAELLP